MNKEFLKRIDYIDNAKAMGIILVLTGHLTGDLPIYIINLIYSFHMPLFFFISGYLLKEKYLDLNYKAYLKRLMVKIIIPYMLFGILSLIFIMLENKVKKLEFNIVEGIYGLLYGTGEFLSFNIVLWFFTALFSVSLMYYFLYKWLGRKEIIFFSMIIGVISCYLTPYISIRMPWNIELALIALFFYALGHYMSFIRLQYIQKYRHWYLCLASLVILMYGTLINGRVDMNTMQFSNPILFYLTALAGILFTIQLSLIVKRNRLAIYLSDNTITLFPLHLIYFSVFTGVGIKIFSMGQGFQWTYEYNVLYIVMAVLINWPISILIRKYLPFIMGIQNKGKN